MTEFISPDHPRITQWNLQDFEWLGILRTGKLPAYDSGTGKRLVDKTILQRRKMTEAEIFSQEQRKRRPRAPVLETSRPISNYLPEEAMPIEKMVALRLNLGADTPVIPPGAKAVDFSGESMAIWLSRIRFLRADVDAYEQANGLHDTDSEPQQDTAIPAAPIPAAPTPEQTDPEAFIRSLQVSYLDNSEIKIQYKGKRKNHNCDSMKFRDSKTEEWNNFLGILQATEDKYRDNAYRLGPAYSINKKTHQKERIPEYDSRYHLLKEIDKKLKSYLSKEYNVDFPSAFNLYERRPDLGKGVYSFKFNIPLDKPSYKTKDQALSRLKMLVREDKSQEAINEAVLTAMAEGASNDEVSKIVKDMCSPDNVYLKVTDDPVKEDEEE